MLPTDPTLTKYRIRCRLMKRRHRKILEHHHELLKPLQKALLEAEHETTLEYRALQAKVMHRIDELGYCVVCKEPLSECKGHIWT